MKDNQNNRKIHKPLTDEQVWGGPPEEKKIVCPLSDNGQCPPGCCMCADFAMQLEFGYLGLCDE